MLQQGAGSIPTCKEEAARLQQLEAKGKEPQTGCDKMQAPGNLFRVHVGRENWGGSEGPPKKCMSGTCDLARMFGGGSTGCFRKPC